MSNTDANGNCRVCDVRADHNIYAAPNSSWDGYEEATRMNMCWSCGKCLSRAGAIGGPPVPPDPCPPPPPALVERP